MSPDPARAKKRWFEINILVLYSLLGKRDVKALHVKCDNAERGCEWEGTLEEHDMMTMCEFTPVSCPKEC